jgi:hypothetical protein
LTLKVRSTLPVSEYWTMVLDFPSVPSLATPFC